MTGATGIGGILFSTIFETNSNRNQPFKDDDDDYIPRSPGTFSSGDLDLSDKRIGTSDLDGPYFLYCGESGINVNCCMVVFLEDNAGSTITIHEIPSSEFNADPVEIDATHVHTSSGVSIGNEIVNITFTTNETNALWWFTADTDKFFIQSITVSET